MSRPRPRFVVALCCVAITIAAFDLVQLSIRSVEDYRYLWLGYRLHGQAARAATIPHVLLCSIGAWGLWRLREWARIGTMAYLAYVLASFVIWGVRGYRSEGVMYVMAWQMFVLPFVTFCFMYLQRGARYFDGSGPG